MILQQNPDLKERTNVNSTTTEPIETSSHIYFTTSRTKGPLQVVLGKIINNDEHPITTFPLHDTESEETFLSKAIPDRLG